MNRPNERLSPEALAALQARYDRGGDVVAAADGTLIVSDLAPIVGETVVVAFDLTRHVRFVRAVLSRNGHVVSQLSDHGEFLFQPNDERPQRFDFAAYDASGAEAFKVTQVVTARFERPRVSIQVANADSARRVAMPAVPVVRYSSANARSLSAFVAGQHYVLAPGDGQIVLEDLAPGDYTAEFVARSRHFGLLPEAESVARTVFSVTRPVPTFDSVAIEPIDPFAGEPVFLRVACRNGQALRVVGRHGEICRSEDPRLALGRTMLLQLGTMPSGDQRFLVIAEGGGGETHYEVKIKGRVPKPNLELFVSSPVCVGQRCHVRWRSDGCRGLFLSHNIPDLEGIDPTRQVPFTGGGSFVVNTQGDFRFEIRAETFDRNEVRKSAMFRAIEDDDFDLRVVAR